MTSILHTRNEVENAIERLGNARNSGIVLPSRSSIVVRRPAAAVVVSPSERRTARGHGLSAGEQRILSAAAHVIQKAGRPIWIVTEAHDASEREARDLIAKVKSDVVQIWRREGIAPLYVEVLEARPMVHSNLIAPIPVGVAIKPILDRLNYAMSYSEHVKAKRAHDLPGLLDYLRKEATPEAHYAADRSYRRNKGSHPLGDGGGDRVRPSRALEAYLLERGLMEPRRKTYASRGLPKTEEAAPSWIAENNGQLRLFERPDRIRLQEFRSGKIPPSLATEIEDKRIAMGISQREFSARFGLSQPQYSNAIKGRFGIGRTPVAIMQGLLLAA